jgi:hypothetical protein
VIGLEVVGLEVIGLKVIGLKVIGLKVIGLKVIGLKVIGVKMGATPQLRAKAGYEPFTSVYYPASCNITANGRHPVVRNAGLSFIASFSFAGG